MALLEIEALHVDFPTQAGELHAVDGVSLTVDEGEVLGIVGESGSGKSTLLRAMTRLLPNVELAELSGSVRFCGSDDDGLKLRQIGTDDRRHVPAHD